MGTDLLRHQQMATILIAYLYPLEMPVEETTMRTASLLNVYKGGKGLLSLSASSDLPFHMEGGSRVYYCCQ